MRRSMTLTLRSGRVITNLKEINNFLRRLRKKGNKNVSQLINGITVDIEDIQHREERAVGILSSVNGIGMDRLIGEVPDITFVFGKPMRWVPSSTRQYFFDVYLGNETVVVVRADVMISGAPLTSIADVDRELMSVRTLSPDRLQKLSDRRKELLEKLKEAVAQRLNTL